MTLADNTSPLIGQHLAESLIPDNILEEFLVWPPDLFAFTSQILSLTGAYHLTVSPPRDRENRIEWPPNDPWAKPRWYDYVRKVGFKWHDDLTERFTETKLKRCKSGPHRERYIHEIAGRQSIGKSLRGQKAKRPWWTPGKDATRWTPVEVGTHWATLWDWMADHGTTDIEKILCEEKDDDPSLIKNWEAFKALITLHAIADEACVGFGIMDLGPLGEEPDPRLSSKKMEESNFEGESEVAKFAARQLEETGTLATINSQRCRVLPKRHTPQVGITLRSLTSNLAYHRSSVDVKWKHTGDSLKNDFIRRMQSQHKTFSVLLLPWPLEIPALDFAIGERAAEQLKMNEDKYGLFSYAPQTPWFKEKNVRAALDAAREETRGVDMVILPESALSVNEIKRFENVIGEPPYLVSSYVAGVRENPESKGPRRFNDNMVYFKMGTLEGAKDVYAPDVDRTALRIKYPRLTANDIQHKHHRWKLEHYQITNYSLGHVLPPHKEWWEAIKIRRRKVSFINIAYALTICPLICEDLARQDPISDLIRTVGPSLVITILMDGPQKKDRWSARYASVLSEDPGSAVIALTSFGMVNRWRRDFHEPSRVVALWNDGQGLEREIELEQGAAGVLLSLSVDGTTEPCADGRMELFATNRVTLGGVRQIRCKSEVASGSP